MPSPPLRLFNSLTRQLEEFKPLIDNQARVYSCGPTVYNYQHIGNMRAYVFADTLGRVLSYKGYDLRHVVNITDVGHLTSDADAGDDKMEKAASREGKSAWDIARFYQQDFERDLARLNIRKPEHPRATDYVAAMIEWGKAIEAKHCYRLDSGLYFDTSTVPDYGRLARTHTDAGESRIDPVAGKRSPLDFAIWRTTPPGETRQMEWDSPWGRGAPGWHLECSVMSQALLGQPFDIHTGGIDHREIHHPCEIAQNQAFRGVDDPGATIWMHNNWLIDRTGKMSKSSGEFLRLQLLVDKGFHPLAFRLMCLQAHYRSELEFSWEGLAAAFTRLKRMVLVIQKVKARAACSEWPPFKRYTTPPPIVHNYLETRNDGDEWFDFTSVMTLFDQALSNDLNTSAALPQADLALLEEAISDLFIDPDNRLRLVATMDQVFGLNLLKLERSELRIAPKGAVLAEVEIEAQLAERRSARATKDFATSDRIRNELIAAGVEVMDGDPLGWDWRIDV